MTLREARPTSPHTSHGPGEDSRFSLGVGRGRAEVGGTPPGMGPGSVGKADSQVGGNQGSLLALGLGGPARS